MKKWFKFFTLSFFSDKYAKEATTRGYTNLFLGLLLTFAFLWMGVFGGEMLPFGAHYNASPDFVSTVHTTLANPDDSNRIEIVIKDGLLQASREGEPFTQQLVVNTLENEGDKQVFGKKGYEVVVDTRSAETLAEIEAYCVSNDGKDLVISYEEYLALSEVARLNFVFHIRYTGEPLLLTDTLTDTHKAYLLTLGDEKKGEVEKLDSDLADGTLNRDAYQRAIYQLYFTNYYPDISEYEGTSKVPLLRNYYFHQYIKDGKNNYLFIFDDYLTGSFETKGGVTHTFYGFYHNMEDGTLIGEGMDQDTAKATADSFIKASFTAMAPITAYAHAMNVFTFIPFIALMPLVVALLTYSLLRLRGVESVKTFGGVAKIIGSYVWFAGLVAAILTVALSLFVPPSILSVLPMVLFFITLLVRASLFVVFEAKALRKQVEQTSTQTEA